ncbi:hypothetical protein QZH41_009759 [Actinostola sp. cb2023]|nr:hypothetical protein QZH41_009759 [Actinostola sp. cb2023]
MVYASAFLTVTISSGPPKFLDWSKMKRGRYIGLPASYSIRMSCRARGAKPLKYRWLKDGKEIQRRGQDMKTTLWYLRLKNIMRSDRETYTCIVSNKCYETKVEAFLKPSIKSQKKEKRRENSWRRFSTETKNKASKHKSPTRYPERSPKTLTNTPKFVSPPGIPFFAKATMIPDPTIFYCNATGTPPLRYRWIKNGKDMPKRPFQPTMITTLPYLKLTSLIAPDFGRYTCVVSNCYGSVKRSFVLYVS